MLTSKTRLEAFSDATFAIILTILVLELHVPHIEDNSSQAFLAALSELAPKLFSFLFSFFIIAIFWVNHHHIVHQIVRVNTKLLWLNTTLLFFSCLFPFLTAFIGDYPGNPFVVALYPLNMACASIALGAFWKYAFVDTELAPNTLSPEAKRRRIRQDRLATLMNLAMAALAFVWVPITLIFIMITPFIFVVPELFFSHPDSIEE